MEIPLVEPVAIPDIFVSGLGRMEHLGPNMRFTFYALQHPINGDCHGMERVIVARLILSAEAATSAAMAAIASTDTDLFPDKPTH